MENSTIQQIKKSIKILGKFFIIIISIALWYLSIPVITIWYLYKRNKTLSKKAKLVISILVSVIFVSLGLLLIYSNRGPSININAPESNSSFNVATTTIRGSMSPSTALLTINSQPVIVTENGDFDFEVRLSQEKNEFIIIGDRAGHTKKVSLILNRVFSAEEIAEKQTKAEERKLKAEATKKAELNAYYATKAGKICKAHPEWSKDDCQSLADNQIWVGMTYNMLVYERGRPTHINPSNYGGRTKYQYCWTDYTPSCFYDNNGDDVIDAFN